MPCFFSSATKENTRKSHNVYNAVYRAHGVGGWRQIFGKLIAQLRIVSKRYPNSLQYVTTVLYAWSLIVLILLSFSMFDK